MNRKFIKVVQNNDSDNPGNYIEISHVYSMISILRKLL